RIQTRSWEDKDGNRRYTTEIVAKTMQMLGPVSKREDGGPASEFPVEEPPDISDDDIPF
ncbi:MAG: single-stranded DNA-binding protein, partial [Deltaproteobacteria bacterium]|nr:single-stranded DNA-binding protein [Deltaproteobacteria bacterium]MBW2027069.1 single-stranded DNA-binding protein [Deltaproteobacteria bacterium]MBW2127093.1 single-stranded DNA-binding protein [Deltaproteobacteria bacterium]